MLYEVITRSGGEGREHRIATARQAMLREQGIRLCCRVLADAQARQEIPGIETQPLRQSYNFV